MNTTLSVLSRLLPVLFCLAASFARAEDFTIGQLSLESQSPAPVQEADIDPVEPATPPPAPGGGVFMQKRAAPAAPASAASAPAADDAPAAEPRILRGNDRVLGPAPRVAPITGPATALRFEEAPITEVVHTVFGEIVKADYVIHPPVSGAITLSTRAAIPPDQILLLLEATLQANGVVLARDSRGIYHIGKPDVLRGIVSPPRRVGSGPLPPGYGTVIVPLQFVGAAEMAEILRPVAPGEAIVRTDTLRNVLILAGTRTQIEGWLELVSTFDVDLLKGMSVGVFPLKYASVSEVQAALRMMTSSPAASTPAGAAAAPGAGTGAAAAAAQAASPARLPESNPLYGAVRILPIERLNSILVVTPRAAYLDQARAWIERLDRPSDNGNDVQLFVYPVQNGSARHLATVLNGIFGAEGGRTAASGATGVTPGVGASTGSTFGTGRQRIGSAFGGGGGAFSSGAFGSGSMGSGAFGGSSSSAFGGARGNESAQPGVTTVASGPGIRIVADEINNAILIYGSRAEYNRIEASLRRLDIAPVQVLIEATIIEVTLSDELKYGLQWFFQDKLRDGWKGTGVLSDVAGGSRLALPGAGFSYSVLNPFGDIRAVLNALADKSLIKVISSPSLMVLDNHPAGIIVGNQQPVETGSSVSDSGVISTSIQYKDTGVALNVIPSVNAGNIVTMDIIQSVTDVGDPDIATSQRPFMQRQISSKVAVRSNETLVLGGLIRDNDTNGRAGVPVLHDLPVLGHLFGSTSRMRERTELIVVITPRVVRSDQDVRDVSDELRERMKSLATFDSATLLGRQPDPSPARRRAGSGDFAPGNVTPGNVTSGDTSANPHGEHDPQ